MDTQDDRERFTYCIAVQGLLDGSWSEWFSGLSVSVASTQGGRPVTLLTGPVVDQPALRGILNKLWDLNLTLISVVRIPADPLSQEMLT